MAIPLINQPIMYVFSPPPTVNLHFHFHDETPVHQRTQVAKTHEQGVQIVEQSSSSEERRPIPRTRRQANPNMLRTGPCDVCGVTENLQWRPGPGDTDLCNKHGLRYRKFIKLFPGQEHAWNPALTPAEMKAGMETRSRMKMDNILNTP